MSEIGDTFAGMRADSQERRAKNREASPDILRAHGLEFQTRKDGAHLVVDTPRGKVDFWPGTGLWLPRGGHSKARGVFRLLAWATAGRRK